MKATIVKNDNFETIGLRVDSSTGSIIYSWGIAPLSFYYTKEVTSECSSNLERMVSELVRLDAKLAMLEEFDSMFFNTLKVSDIEIDKPVNMSTINARIEIVKREINELISSIAKLR